MSMQALSGDSACVSAEVYKAVEERLGKLSTAPSVHHRTSFVLPLLTQ